MMVATLVSAALLSGNLQASTAIPGGAAPPPPPCAGVYDRTDACTAPATTPTAVAPDAKAAAPKPTRDPLSIPTELGFFAVASAGLGGAALVTSALNVGNGASTLSDTDEDHARTAARLGGVCLLATSGALLSSAVALWLFDPSTGKMRVTIEDGD